MDTSQPYSREYQRKVVDAEIKSLEESIRVLKHRRNALTPVSSLPTEVINAIFSFLRVKLSPITPGKTPDPLAWLRVAHVCQQWREIVLNQPLFWNHVNFATLSSAGVAEIIARSKNMPLYLEARTLGSDWDNARYSAFQEELQACISRTRHLFISANSSHLHNIINSLVSPAPTLESLTLYCKRQSFQPVVPNTLFGGATPRLSCLKLRNCTISWKSPLLKGLITLEIRSTSFTMKLDLLDWLDALGEMQQLKMLTLHLASPMARSFHTERTVMLPSLTHLDIGDSPWDCAFALAHLKLPALACLYIQTFSSLPHGEGVQEVLPYVSRHAHTQPLQTMLIRGNGRWLDIFAWAVPDIDVEVHEPPTLPTTTPPVLRLPRSDPHYGMSPDLRSIYSWTMTYLREPG